jgi:uncharacterized damage-inducible protein DinB
MGDRTYAITMAEYNEWMNQKLYAICAEIPDHVRKSDRGAFFKSIHGTLNHLLYGDRAWIRRFTGQSFDLPEMGVDLYADFEELHQARIDMDQIIRDWAGTLSEEWLQQTFQYTSASTGVTHTRPAWILVTHMFNHQTHHRGQLTTLLSQLGYAPGVTDLPWLPTLDVTNE